MLSLPVFSQFSHYSELLEPFQKKVEADKLVYELALVRLRKSYHGALEKLMALAQQQGDLQFFEALEAEIKRTSETPDAPQELSVYPEFEKVQNILIQERERIDRGQAFSIVGVYRKLDEALIEMRQNLVRNGKITEAKDLEKFRLEKMNDPVFVEALELTEAAVPRVIPPSTVPPGSNLTLEKLQSIFNGNVTQYNPITHEIEVAYGFEKESELDDFFFRNRDAYTVQDGKLMISAFENTNWWSLIDMRSDYLVVPFLLVDNSWFFAELSDLKGNGDFHFAFGYSDLLRKTIGMGPFSGNKDFTVEGWTPKDDQLRGESSGVTTQFPATVTVEHRGNKIDFTVQAGGRKKTVTVRTDDSVTHVGVYPKSWAKGSSVLSLENMRVKGVLSEEWLKAKLESR